MSGVLNISVPCNIGDTLFIIRRGEVCKFVVDRVKVGKGCPEGTVSTSLHGLLYIPKYRWGYPYEVTLGNTTFGRVLFHDKKSATIKLQERGKTR